MKHIKADYPFQLFFTCLFLGGFFQTNAIKAAEYNRASDPHRHTIFMEEGGWCWFQDPRAIIHQGKLLLGAVQGNDDGSAYVGVYDLQTKQVLGKSIMHKNFKRDDHNSPVMYARPDGTVLAMYALHNNNKLHYYRISKSADLLTWGDELTFKHDYPNAGTVTYMNLYSLPKEKKLYNFFRGIEFNPCFMTSLDEGVTWGEPTHFIANEILGRHRPYTRYASNGTDTIHVCFTDGHPDQFGNSIYYAKFRDGNFYRANGEFIKNLKQDGPLKPSESDLVFAGSGKWAPKGRASAKRSAWTSSIVLDESGQPHLGYSLHLSNEDHRYRIASWDGTKWIDREVAHAGQCLYDTQTSYTGLITIDPGDASRVVISTNVDPTTGEETGSKHEIYQATIKPEDDVKTIRWDALTKDSPVRNLRPVIVRGDGYRVIAWLRGDFQSYIDYQLDVVGLVEKVDDGR